MNTESIPIIELNQANPKQRGQAYGEAARSRIENIMAVYREVFQRITGETWNETLDRGAPFILKAKAFAPDLVEEIQGIAQKVSPMLSEFANDIRLNVALFKKIETVYQLKNVPKWQ